MKYRDFLTMLFEAEQTDNQTEQPTGAPENGTETPEKSKETKPETKYTDEDVDRIINRKFAEWQKKQEKAVAEAEKLAKMNEQERAEHQAQEWERKYNELLARNTRAELTVEARRMLDAAHITGLSDNLVATLITEDAETTKANVENFAALFGEAVKNAVQELNRRPSPKVGAGTSQLTKDEILKIKDVNERQRLIKENISLFR